MTPGEAPTVQPAHVTSYVLEELGGTGAPLAQAAAASEERNPVRRRSSERKVRVEVLGDWSRIGAGQLAVREDEGDLQRIELPGSGHVELTLRRGRHTFDVESPFLHLPTLRVVDWPPPKVIQLHPVAMGKLEIALGSDGWPEGRIEAWVDSGSTRNLGSGQPIRPGGRLLVPALYPGQYQVRVGPRMGYSFGGKQATFAVRDVVIQAGQMTYLTIERPGQGPSQLLRGRLMRRGQPLADANVSLRSRWLRDHARTGSQGKFQLTVPPTGTATLSITLPEGGKVRRVLQLPQTVPELTIELPSGDLTGEVFDHHGNPLNGLLVRAVPLFEVSSTTMPPVTEEALCLGNRYRFADLIPGPWRLEVGGPDPERNSGRITRASVHVQVGRREQIAPPLVVPMEGVGRGRFLTPDGLPVAGAGIWMQTGDHGWEHITTSNREGRFTVRQLPVGTYSFYARTLGSSTGHAGLGTFSLTLLPAGGREQAQDLTLSAGAQISIQARTTGEHVEALETQVLLESVRGNVPPYRANWQWTHLLGGIAPGDYHMTVTTRDDQQQRRRLRVEADQVLDLSVPF